MPTLQINDLKKQLNQPLFALAGASEVALDYARAYVTETQDRLAKTQDRLARTQDRLAGEAEKGQTRFEARFAELQKDAAAVPGKVQVQLLAALADAAKTYAELAERGEKLVAAIRTDGVKAVTAVKDAPDHSTVVRRETQQVADTEGKTVRKPAAKKTPARTTTPRQPKA